MKYSDWLDDWMDNYVLPSAKAKTIKTYEEVISNHLRPDIGDRDIDAIEAIELQRYVTGLLRSGNLLNGKGLSVNTVNLIITVIQSSLRAANEIGVTEKSVWQKIKRPKHIERDVYCFTEREQRLIENAIRISENGKYFGILLALYTGMRIGELLALEWRDVDLRRGEISVNKTCHDVSVNGHTEREMNSPKTSSSKRVIPIPRKLIPLIKEHKKNSRSQYVICDSNKPVIMRSYQRTFEHFLDRLGIKHRGFHALRHTFATRALECGMDVKTLSEVLGHKSTSITLNRYVHSMPRHKRDMMNRLGRLL